MDHGCVLLQIFFAPPENFWDRAPKIIPPARKIFRRTPDFSRPGEKVRAPARKTRAPRPRFRARARISRGPPGRPVPAPKNPPRGAPGGPGILVPGREISENFRKFSKISRKNGAPDSGGQKPRGPTSIFSGFC